METESTSEATRILLEGLVAATNAHAGRVLFLDLRTGHFDQRSQVGHGEHVDIPPIPAAGIAEDAGPAPGDILEIAAKSGRPAWYERDSRSAPSRWHEPATQYRLAHPVLRVNTAVALVDLEGERPLSIADLGDTGELLRQVLIRTYERRFTLRLLYELQQPVDVNQTRIDFFDDLARIIRTSSGMEFVAIREYDQEADALQCVAAKGLGVERGEFEELDWLSLDDYPSFRDAVEGKTVAEPTMAAEHLRTLREVPHLKHVRSFAALPIIVGDQVIGVLSVAARCPYEFSRVELRGFETVANAIGVAMANFKNLHVNSERVRRITEQSAGALNDLLAQSARHQAKLQLDNVQKLLYLIAKTLRRRDPKNLLTEIEAISEQLKTTRETLDKMRTNVLLQPGQSPVRANVREIVLNAAEQVSGELDAYDIDIELPAPFFIQVVPETMTLAFLLLLQNSIHAFTGSKARKRGRQIEVSVAARQAGSNTVRVSFADNATGIDPNRLRIPPELSDMPWEEALFERGVTGTREGTGFGLYLVRTLVDLAGGGTPGTIQLVEHRNRVVFALDLPTAD